MEAYFKELVVAISPKQAEKQLANIKQCFEDELDTKTIDFYLLHVFNTNYGIITFIDKAVQQQSGFDKLIQESIELLYELVKNLSLKLNEHASAIVKICIFIVYAKVTPTVKQRACNLMKLILNQKLDVNDDVLEKLYDMFNNPLTFQDKPGKGVTVAASIRSLYGVFARAHPLIVKNDIVKFRNTVSELAQTAGKPDAALKLATAQLECINNCLYTYKQEASIYLDVPLIYSAIKAYGSYGSEHKKVTNRAALQLFADHCNLFTLFIYNDARWWHETIEIWVDSVSREDFKVGVVAMNALQQVLVTILDGKYVEISDEAFEHYNIPFENSVESHREIFTYIFSKFKAQASDETLPTHKRRLAIGGLSLLSDVCVKYLTETEINELFIDTVQRVEYLYDLKSDVSDRYIELLPDYVAMLSRYMNIVREFDRNHLRAVKTYTILLIRLIPRLNVHYNLVVDALASTINAMAQQPQFLSDVVHQGVMWSCSHAPVADVAQIDDGKKKFTTYKTFTPLWLRLMRLPNAEHRQCLFDELIKTLLMLINKLNVDVRERVTAETFTDPSRALEATSVSDHTIFINVVDFYVDILSKANCVLVNRWICSLTMHLIGKSMRYAINSGFYKLIAAVLTQVDALDYFREDNLSHDHINACYQSVCGYIELVLDRMAAYKDDLHLACVRVVLSAPGCVISKLYTHYDFSDMFVTLFTVGRSYHRIAALGLDTLNRWKRIFNPETMHELLKRVVPCLDTFLRSNYIIGYEASSNDTIKSRRKYDKRVISVDTPPELLALQEKILVFLGGLDDELSQHFVNANVRIETLPWSNEAHLNVSLPYHRTNITLHLEKYLLRVLELALECSGDRRTKVAACEFLHGSIMVLLGSYVQIVGGGSKMTDLNTMLVRCTNAVLTLACDNDVCVRGLFHPLMLQLMHWLSHPQKIDASTAQDLLEVVLDGVTNAKDASIRDLSGACLNEFITWGIKQTPPSRKPFQSSNFTNNMDLIIEKLKYFSAHPDRYKRCGAAIIFNNIYAELREEETLIDQYWYDILVALMTNLSMAEWPYDHYAENLRCVELALDRILRVYIEKSKFFNSDNKRFNKQECKTLRDVVTYLFGQTNNMNLHCRRKAMEMFVKLYPLAENISIADLSDVTKYDVDVSTDRTDNNNPHASLTNLKKLLHYIDGCIFIMEHMYIEYHYCDETKLITYVQYYTTNIQTSTLHGLIVSRDIKEHYNHVRMLLAEQLLKILDIDRSHDEFYNADMWRFLCNYLFDPTSLGYDPLLTHKSKNYYNRFKRIISNLQMIDDFTDYVRRYVADNNSSYISCCYYNLASIPKRQRDIQCGLIVLHDTKLAHLVTEITINYLDDVLNGSLENIDGTYHVKPLPVTVSKYCELKIELALLDETQLLKAIRYVTDSRQVIDKFNTTTYGLHFFNTYSDYLISAIIKRGFFAAYLQIIGETNDSKHFMELLDRSLKLIQFNNSDKSNYNYIAETFYENFTTHINRHFTANILNAVEMMRNYSELFRCSRLPCEDVIIWMIKLLSWYGSLFDAKSIIESLGAIIVDSKRIPLLQHAFHKLKNRYIDAFKSTRWHTETSLIVKALFRAAIQSKCYDFLAFGLELITICGTDFDIDVNQQLQAMFRHCPDMQQESILNAIYDTCMAINDRSKLRIADYLCVLLQHAEYSIFEGFYARYIHRLLGSLMVVGENIASVSDDIINNIIYMKLIAVLGERIEQGKFATRTCPITKAAFGDGVKHDRELIRQLTSVCLRARKKPIPPSDGESFRLYQCAAYKAIVSIICNNTSQTDIKFYNYLLYHDGVNNEDILWSKLVEVTKTYNFSLSYDDPPKRCKILLNIRGGNRNRQEYNEFNYIQSQHLFKSSLVEDVTRYDLTTSSLRHNIDEEDQYPLTTLDVELLNEDINNEECMATLCGVFKQMHNYQLLDDAEANWVSKLRKILLNDGTHRNVALFLGKAIENSREFLSKHGTLLMGPLMKIVSEQDNNGINSFAADILVMILTTWFEAPIHNDDVKYIKLIADYLVVNLFHERADIFKQNLRIFQHFVEKFHVHIDILPDVILKHLQVSSDSKQLLAGIHIVNTLIINRIKPWGEKMSAFAKLLVAGLTSTHRSIYVPCSETIGVVLKYITNDHVLLAKFEKLVKDELGKMKRCGDDKLAYCLDAIVKHHPSTIYNDFVSVSIYNLASLPPSIKCFYLQMFLTCIEKLHEDTYCLRKFDFRALLDDGNWNVQLRTLELIKSMLGDLSPSQLDDILPMIVKFTTHQINLCRNCMYEILMAIYDRFWQSEDDLCIKLVESSKKALVLGLIDTPEIHAKILTFWHQVMRTLDIEDVCIYIFVNLYAPKVEHRHISNHCALILKYLHDGSNFDNIALFNQPLHQCRFNDYQLNSSWRVQHSTMTTPLFVSTQLSEEYLRATQTQREFLPTVANTLLNDAVAEEEPPETTDSSGTKHTLISQRFRQKQSDVSKFFAHQQIKKNRREMGERIEKMQKKQSDVKIYRKYRSGDYPDIEIKLAPLIDNLIALVESDTQIAKTLYVELFDATLINAHDADAFTEQAQRAIAMIFETTNDTPTFIGALIEIALSNAPSLVFDATLISSVCLRSGLMSLGCLLIEEYLIAAVQEDDAASKRRRVSLYDDKSMHWMKLAELYKWLQEWDVVHGIFMHQIEYPTALEHVQRVVKLALVAESQCQWKEAQEFYVEAINVQSECNEFYFEACFKCSAELSDWELVDRQINVALNNPSDVWEKLWESDWHRIKLLPYYLTSQIRIGLNNTEVTNRLLTAINRYLDHHDDYYRDYMTNNFADDLSFIGVHCNDMNLAKKFLTISMNNFLNDWRDMNPLYSSLRIEKCHALRNLISIKTFIREYENLTDDNCETILDNLKCLWLNTNSESSTASNALHFTSNEKCFVYRRTFIDVLSKRYQHLLGDFKFDISYAFVQQCLATDNYAAAKKYLRAIVRSGADEEIDERKEALINHALCQFNFLQARRQDVESKKYDALLKALKMSAKCMENNHFDTDHRLMLERSTLLHNVIQELVPISTCDVAQICTQLNVQGIDSTEALEKYALDFVNKSIECIYKTDGTSYSHRMIESLADTHYKLATFMKCSLSNRDQFIYHMFQAMKFDSKDARLMFSYLLDLDTIATTHCDTFIKESANIPSWMFLYWIPQLLAYMDTAKVNATYLLILRMVRDYPNAFIYSYKLSRTKYRLVKADDDGSATTSSHLVKTRELCEILDTLLGNEIIDKLLDSLRYVRTTKSLINSAIDRLKKACHQTSSSEEKFRQVANDVYAELFDLHFDYCDVESSAGLAFKEAGKYASQFSKIIKGTYDVERIMTELGKLKPPPTIKTHTHKINDLGFYSQWLKNFRASNHKEEIEIPGQYLGDRRPLPQYHIKVYGFLSQVKVLTSIREPIRISILGNDVKEYRFLVKQGEDLRQDQRIMQMYDLMNGIFSADAACALRKLNIYTYSVIPLTINLGLIEWVDKTKTLREFIYNSSQNVKQRSGGSKLDLLRDKYLRWLNRAKKRDNEPIHVTYANATLRLNKKDTTVFFTGLVNEVPWNILRKAFASLGIDAAHFFALRSAFACNYATMCIADWLLGIGDRHLSNILVAIDDGRMLGIDFGYAFGASVQELRIPELLPFRLTPQILNLLQPLKERGYLQESMTHALRALRAHKDKLLSAMNVCLHEPTIDWLESANNADYDEQNLQWHPKEKIKQVQDKFRGMHPAKILIEAVKSRKHDNERVRQKYVEFLSDHIDADDDDGAMSAEQQVEALLHLATDFNLSARMFCGWEAWI